MRAITSRVLLPLLVAGLAAASPTSAVARAGGPPVAGNAVVALTDTGINPYHQVFRDRSARAYQYPGSYLPNYPRGAIALRLTLDDPDYLGAVQQDCERVWSKVRTGQLYWFPGTKVVGAISFGAIAPIRCGGSNKNPLGRILNTGHGTMTASRATSTSYGACRECRVVSVQMPLGITPGSRDASTDSARGIRWAAANAGWIDVQSNSWGPFMPAWVPAQEAGLVTADPSIVRAIEESSRAQLSFWASGNGAAFRLGVVGHPTLLAPHLGPSALIVGGDDSGYVTSWPGFTPTLASDACSSWATDGPTTTESTPTTGGGTSAATPYVAGGAARIALEARRILGDHRTGVHAGVVASGQPGLVPRGPLADGRFTVSEWRDVLLHTATARPVAEHDDGPPCDATAAPYQATPLLWKDVPASVPGYLLIGYGTVDTPAKELAFRVLRGAAPLPARPDEDRYRALDQQLRTTLYTAYSQG